MDSVVLTSRISYLIDTCIEEPPIGSQVLGLSVGGKLCETVWNSSSSRFFDAWCTYPKIPKSVRKRQCERYDV